MLLTSIQQYFNERNEDEFYSEKTIFLSQFYSSKANQNGKKKISISPSPLKHLFPTLENIYEKKTNHDPEVVFEDPTLALEPVLKEIHTKSLTSSVLFSFPKTNLLGCFKKRSES